MLLLPYTYCTKLWDNLLLRIWPGCSMVPKYGASENILEEIAQVFIFFFHFTLVCSSLMVSQRMIQTSCPTSNSTLNPPSLKLTREISGFELKSSHVHQLATSTVHDANYLI